MGRQPGRRHRPRRRRTMVLAVAGIVLMASCSGGDDDTAPTTTAEPLPTTTTMPRVNDGELRIGVLLPRTGAGASLGEPLIGVIEQAVATINEAGGVLGQPVRLVVRDEGPETADAVAAAASLVDADAVDAVIGPASTPVALNVVPQLVDAGVLTCSPLATGAALAELPDNGDFVRSVASDGLLAQAMVRTIEDTGVRATALAYPDDTYGRRYARALRVALGGRGITIVSELAYDPADDSFDDEVTRLLADNPPVVALAGEIDGGSRVLATVLSASPATFVVANDPFVRLDLATLSAAQIDALDRFTGVAIDASNGEATLASQLGLADGIDLPPFASEAVDCLHLIALSAVQAGTDDPTEMAAQVNSVSRGGSGCASFVQCQSLLEQDLNIDYNGATGLVALDANGDQSASRFVRYGFDAGVLTELSTFVVSSAP